MVPVDHVPFARPCDALNRMLTGAHSTNSSRSPASSRALRRSCVSARPSSRAHKRILLYHLDASLDRRPPRHLTCIPPRLRRIPSSVHPSSLVHAVCIHVPTVTYKTVYISLPTPFTHLLTPGDGHGHALSLPYAPPCPTSIPLRQHIALSTLDPPRQCLVSSAYVLGSPFIRRL